MIFGLGNPRTMQSNVAFAPISTFCANDGELTNSGGTVRNMANKLSKSHQKHTLKGTASILSANEDTQ